MPDNLNFDPYAVLQVTRDASPEVIKAAHRALISQFHPDHQPDDPDSLDHSRRLNAARDLLLDPATRRAHDLAHPSSDARATGKAAPPVSSTQRPASNSGPSASPSSPSYPDAMPPDGDFGRNDTAVRRFLSEVASVAAVLGPVLARIQQDYLLRRQNDREFVAAIDGAFERVRSAAVRNGRKEAQDRAWWATRLAADDPVVSSFATPMASMLVVEDLLDPSASAAIRRHWRWITSNAPGGQWPAEPPPRKYPAAIRLVGYVMGCIAAVVVAQVGAVLVVAVGTFTNLAGIVSALLGTAVAEFLIALIGNIAFAVIFGWLVGESVRWLLRDPRGRAVPVASITAGVIGFVFRVISVGLLVWAADTVPDLARPILESDTARLVTVFGAYGLVGGLAGLGLGLAAAE